MTQISALEYRFSVIFDLRTIRLLYSCTRIRSCCTVISRIDCTRIKSKGILYNAGPGNPTHSAFELSPTTWSTQRSSRNPSFYSDHDHRAKGHINKPVSTQIEGLHEKNYVSFLVGSSARVPLSPKNYSASSKSRQSPTWFLAEPRNMAAVSRNIERDRGLSDTLPPTATERQSPDEKFISPDGRLSRIPDEGMWLHNLPIGRPSPTLHCRISRVKGANIRESQSVDCGRGLDH